ncbi:3035_t:CDS:2 [Dentiscutata erythropus]|uniref:D-arabinono-1,4-lactone oxidase n=1 Tax=Dentiscutata erythropus TaxID=1348616 RepID=A0A9N9N3M7_9GLOM|nr:3035_t:CDS:2 [Dentiscutata erythropus]
MAFVKDAFIKIKNDIEHLGEKEWHNWGENQECTPDQIFRPVNLHDLKAIVKKAKKRNKKIRCAAAGHSWSSLSVTNGYLVIVNDLNDIKIHYNEKLKTWTVTTEAGVYLKDLVVKLRNHDPPLTFDSLPVLTTVTTSGIVSTGSHGARCASSNVAEKVISFQIVTSNGELREFSDEIDPVEMSAARISLGLLGIIYKLTFRVEPMFNSKMKDRFPKISDYWKAENLKNDVLNCESVEIFYMPFNASGLEEKNDKLWVKTCKRVDMNVTESQLELKLKSAFQIFGLKFGDHLFEFITKCPESTPYITNLVFNVGLNHESEEILQAPDAIHFQTGVDNFPCMDLEFSFKVNHVYELAAINKYPLNITAEFRINKASKCLLASTYDEDPDAYYCLMEILSVNGTQDFLDFSIELAERWMKKYNALPHWGKMWEHVPGIIPYIRNNIRKRLDEFEKVRAKYDPDEYFFDNESLRQLFVNKE